MKSYTDIEQSKKLAEILPLETADNYYSWHDERYYIVNKDCPYPYSLKEKIPCWSLTALLDVLPIIEGFRPIIDLDINLIRYEGNYRDELCFNESNLIDACYEMLIKLHELNLL